MKVFLALIAFMVVCTSAYRMIDHTMDVEWLKFKLTYNKKYEMEQETHRRLVWESNLKYINQHNLQASLGKKSFTLKMNKFGDLVRFRSWGDI
jgi:cathepsin L